MPSLLRFGFDTLRHAGTNQCGVSSAAPISGFGDDRDHDPRVSKRYQRIESPNAGMAMGGT
jgi:hypothetical protein